MAEELLREKIAIEFFKSDCPHGEWLYATEMHKEKCLRKANCILALIPTEEELRRQLHLADKNYLELKNAFDERLQEAKCEERERIFNILREHGHDKAVGSLTWLDTLRQNLKEVR